MINILVKETLKNFRKPINQVLCKIRRRSLTRDDFSIISNNCWGGFIYQYFGLPYKSPFIGLFLFAPDYIRLLSDLKKYMNIEPKFIKPENSKYANEVLKNGMFGKYPIGIIDDIEIHFLHYKDKNEALEKWERRKRRINYDYLIIKFCDRDLATEKLIREFCNLQFAHKICLTSKENNFAPCVKLKNENGPFIENEWRNFLKTVNPTKMLRKFDL